MLLFVHLGFSRLIFEQILFALTEFGEYLLLCTYNKLILLCFRYVKPPIFTLCVGNAWGEAALLLAAGAKGNRSALPSSTIMMKQVFS